MIKYKGSVITGFVVIFILLAGSLFRLNSRNTPNFSLKRFDGSTYNLGDHLGKKIIIIEFWASWCKPCKKILKKLNQIFQDNNQEVEVLAITIDSSSNQANAEAYINGKGYTLTVLLDPDHQVIRIFNPSRKLPFTVIIDKKGEIVHTHTGYIPGYEREIEKKVENLIDEGK